MTPPERMAHLEMLDFPIVAAHCVHLTPADIELLDRPGFGVAHNPASNLKLQSGRAPVEQLLGRRLAVGLGSDGCGSNDVVDILREAYLAAILHPWREDQPAAHASLAMATREGARALGLQGEIGTVEVGKQADLILVRLDAARTTPVNDPTYALAYTARGDDVTTTVVNGRVLMEERVVTTLDEAEVLAQARARATRIFGAPYPGGG
jgi:5-methylthioadenosine/S-adenosylhomocysteine deaminase